MANSQNAGSGRTQEHMLLVRALTSLAYEPAAEVDDAAARLSRAPQLVQDLFAYVMAGKPPADDATRTPPELFAPLPNGYTVASLMRDFGFTTVGAFLMASELVADTARAEAMLTQMIEEGYFTTSPSGVRALVFPRVSQHYPSCPNCGRHSKQHYDECPRCGYGEFEQQLDRGEIPDEIIRAYLAAPARVGASVPGDAQAVCSKCNTPARPTQKFCVQCGGAVTMVVRAAPPAPPVAPPAATGTVSCAKCGTILRETQRFCTSCGTPVVRAAPPPPKPAGRACTSCGVAAKPGVKFCTNCGQPLPR